MDNYLEIEVLPDLEADANFLMNNLCSKLHAVLGQTTQGQVGISFPEHGRSLGSILRLHGSRCMLEKLMALPWLKGLRDYCNAGDILVVPENAQHCYFARRQVKSAHNKRQRSITKGWLKEEEALITITDQSSTILTLPFIRLTSRGNKQQMKVFVERGKVTNTPVTGKFNSYGLSRLSEKVTVPYF